MCLVFLREVGECNGPKEIELSKVMVSSGCFGVCTCVCESLGDPQIHPQNPTTHIPLVRVAFENSVSHRLFPYIGPSSYLDKDKGVCYVCL